MQTDTHAVPLLSVSANPDEWLTIEEGSAEVKVHHSTLRREIRAGRLRHARVGTRGHIRIRRSWLNAWLEQSVTPVEVRR